MTLPELLRRAGQAAARAESSAARSAAAVRRWAAPPGNLSGAEAPPRDGRAPLVDRFAAVLSVIGHDPDRRLFVLNRGGLSAPAAWGRVWELDPVLALERGHAAALDHVLRLDLPPESVFSFSLWASPDISEAVADFARARSAAGPRLGPEAAELLAAMARERGRMLTRLSRGGALAGAALPARRFRCWLCLTSPLGDWSEEAMRREAGEIAAAFSGVDAALARSGLLSRIWDRADYLATVRELLNPQLSRDGRVGRARPEPAGEPRDQALCRDTMIDVGKSSILFSGAEAEPVRAVVVAAAGYPRLVDGNDMIGLLGLAPRANNTIADPYLVSAVIQPRDIARDRAATAVRAARVRQLQGSEIGLFLPDLTRRREDIDLAHQACEEGSGLAEMAVEMVVFTRGQTVRSATEAAKALLGGAGFTGEAETGVQLLGLLLALPLEAAAGLLRDARAARRLSTRTREAAARFAPILGQWAGTGPRRGQSRPTPLLSLLSRCGQVFGVDHFANTAGNYNAIVAGTSGSGKSVLAQELVMGTLAGGGRVWVFDIGRSYRNCVELTDGQWIDFASEEGQALCLNPLDVPGDINDSLDEIADIVTALANGDWEMELTESALLKAAIGRVVAAARGADRPATLSDLALDLSGSGDPRLVNLAFRLRPYTAGERFGHWFEGPSSIRFEAALVALEMEALSNKPALQNAVLQIMIMRILAEIRDAPRDQVKLIVIDEAWRLLSGRSGRFIEWACRTLRKYGAGIVCVSQSVEDFSANPVARAVRANADTVFFLRQKEAGIAAASPDPRTREMIAGLTTVDGLFSEVYLRVGDEPGVIGRLALDDFSLTAYSTRADVYERVRALRREGLAPAAAIARAAREKFPDRSAL